MSPNNTVRFLPSLGVWGADGEPLVIDCKAHISKLEIIINAHGKEILNLQGVSILDDDGQNLLLSKVFVNAQLSSNFYDSEVGKPDVTQRLLDGKMLHSKLERNPTLTLHFSKAVYIQSIVLANRPGLYGYRSRFLSILGFGNGRERFQFDNIDINNIASASELSTLLISQTKFPSFKKLNSHAEAALRHCLRWLLHNATQSSFFEKLISEKASTKLEIVTPQNITFAQRYVRKLVASAVEKDVAVSNALMNDLLPHGDSFPSFDSICAYFLCDKISTAFENSDKVAIDDVPYFKRLIKSDIELETLLRFSKDKYPPFKEHNIEIAVSGRNIVMNVNSQQICKEIEASNKVGQIPNIEYVLGREEYLKRESKRHQRFTDLSTKLVAWSQCIEKDHRPPSNTIMMLEQALKYSYNVVELDLRVTKDKNIVLAHDDIVTNAVGDKIVLSNATAEDIAQFTAGKFLGVNYKLNFLEEALPLLKGKKILLDARLKQGEYEYLKNCIGAHNINHNDLIFCVYNINQAHALTTHFPDSLLFWKFYTQLWEIDFLILRQLRLLGIDGIMYLYPHFNENFDIYLEKLKHLGLQSLCFIHGEAWTPEQSVGLTDALLKRSKDNFDKSLERLIRLNVEYVTTTHYKSTIFQNVVKFKKNK